MRIALPLLLIGCYAPTVPASVPCTPGRDTCPRGQWCAPTASGNFCMPDDFVPEPDASTIVDASLDAPALDAPQLLITRRQMSSVAAFNGTTPSLVATWPNATTAGNLLVACMGIRWAGAITITPPPGWQQAIDASPQSGESRARIWYIASAAARSGNETWTFTNGVTYQVALTMFEYAGPTALDRTASSTGTSTTLSTGTTAQTTSASELWFACTDLTGAYTQSAPTNGFTTAQSALVGAQLSGLSAAWLERIVTTQGTASTTTTIGASREWSAAIATFR